MQLTESPQGHVMQRLWHLAPRIVVASYLVGVWYVTVATLTNYSSLDWGVPGIGYVLLSPIVLLVAPWQIAADREGLLPLVLTYGAFAAYVAWHQFLATLKRNGG